ncbi:hypothetical protein [Aliamphritea spongicola]|nr:hypothetical protein [Aliamphritea spongicola]
MDTLALYNQARKRGIIITPGSLFTSQQRYQNCLRIGFAQPWSPARIAALEEVAQLLASE